jgi:hypothetical protein
LIGCVAASVRPIAAKTASALRRFGFCFAASESFSGSECVCLAALLIDQRSKLGKRKIYRFALRIQKRKRILTRMLQSSAPNLINVLDQQLAHLGVYTAYQCNHRLLLLIYCQSAASHLFQVKLHSAISVVPS